MRIIDVDSHFHEPLDWFVNANPALVAKLPQMSGWERVPANNSLALRRRP